MEREELKARIVQQMRTLRDATDQKAAVAWMRDAYLLLESALRELDRAPEPVQVFLPAGPLPLVATSETRVYAVRDSVLHRHPHIWLQGRTVQYENPPPFIRPPAPEPLLLAERSEPVPARKTKKRGAPRNIQYGRN